MKAPQRSGNPQLLFSEIFEAPPHALQKHGAFNISLVTDLPLFVDPFLLFNSRKEVYGQLHRRIIRYLKFLRDQSADHDLDPGLLEAWYKFPEVRQTWLGFTRYGNSGRGLGADFAHALHKNLGGLFPNFGQESITRDSHLENLCLIENGVGRDRISDFTTNLIKEYLLDYTQDFARDYLSKAVCREFPVAKVRFNYGTTSWESSSYVLPIYRGDFVLLTPRDMLTRDETWINRVDLIHDFETIPDSIPDTALRAQVNHYFRSFLSETSTAEDRHRAAIETIFKFPAVVDYYIKNKEDDGERATNLSNTKVQVSEQLYVRQFSELVHLLNENTSFYKTSGKTCEEARQRVAFLKDVIENKGGHRLFYVHGEPIEREEDIHIAYRLTWFGTASDVSREVNDGARTGGFQNITGK